MAIVVLPQKQPTQNQTGMGEFVKGMSPYLQLAFKTMMEKNLKQPEWEMDRKKLKLLEEASKRELLTGVSKGEIPLSSIPQDIQNMVLQPARVDTTGLKGSPETMAGIQNLPVGGGYEFSGTPDFMKRVTPQETPQDAQKRMMESYATQQQSINPYKALQASKLEILLPIYDKYKRKEKLTKDEMILLGTAAKEGGLTSIATEIRDMLEEGTGEAPITSPTVTPATAVTPTPVSNEMVEVTNPAGRRVKIRQSDLDNALKNGYKK